MANEQNLKPLNKRTKSEQREIARLGGKKSGASRRKKKYIKELLEQLLLLDLPECKLSEDMRKLGIAEADMSIQMAMCVMLVKQTLNGNLKAYQLLRDQIRRKPERRCCRAVAKYIFYK